MDSKNFDCGFIIYLILWAKHKKRFGNGGDQIFKQICLRDDFFSKSRQVWTEIKNMDCDEINKGCKKFKYGL